MGGRVGEVGGAWPLHAPKWPGLGLSLLRADTRTGRSHSTLQRQDADVEVFQLAEGADEVQFVLDGPRTVCDQLETCPGRKKKSKERKQEMLLASVIDSREENTHMEPRSWTFSFNFVTKINNS